METTVLHAQFKVWSYHLNKIYLTTSLGFSLYFYLEEPKNLKVSNNIYLPIISMNIYVLISFNYLQYGLIILLEEI